MSNWKSDKKKGDQVEINLGRFDKKGYSPNKVYVRTRDSYGSQVGFSFLEAGEGFFPGDNITKNVLPPTLANAMYQLVHDSKMPWQSVSQFVRDAIVHRIMWALEHEADMQQITNVKLAQSLEKLSLLHADALREGAEAYRQAMRTAKEMLDLPMMERVNHEFCADMVRTGDSHVPWVQERADTFDKWIRETEIAIGDKKRADEEQAASDYLGEQAAVNDPDYSEHA